jgi:mannosyltransferase
MRRPLLAAGALALALAAVFLPTGWYEAIPRSPDTVLPFPGTHLLRICFFLEAAALAFLFATNARFTPLSPVYGAIIPARRHFTGDLSRRVAMIVLAAITIAGVLLRVFGLGQDLWIDEITPLIDYSGLHPVQVIGSYIRPNNHLLNTLLQRMSIGAFGEAEWSARLPAVVFGALTIPAMYWVSRTALSRAASLAAALILALSYHHVFFSQNARGYSAYLFFALLATGLLVEALRNDRLAFWALYVASLVLGCASLLITGFVVVSHVLLFGATGWLLHRRRVSVWPFARRIVTVMAIAGLLIFHMYSTALPEAYVVINSMYAEPGTGYAPFSLEFFREMQRGLSEGFGSTTVVAAFLLLGLAGYLALLSFSWPLGTALLLPPLVTAIALAARGLTFSPRFFLLVLPLAIMGAVSGMGWVTLYLQKKGVLRQSAANITLAFCAALVAFAAGRSLPYYYRTPKQAYRPALVLVERVHPTRNIVVISNAAAGFQYYTRRMPVRDSARYLYVRDTIAFDSLTAGDYRRSPVVLTTFSRALDIELPGIAARLARSWQVDTTFAWTVGDGEIMVWSKKVDSTLHMPPVPR